MLTPGELATFEEVEAGAGSSQFQSARTRTGAWVRGRLGRQASTFVLAGSPHVGVVEIS